MANTTRNVKRYNLVLPEELYEEVQRVALEQHTTVVELLRKFIKLGLLAVDIENTPDAQLIIREGEKERQLVLL